ncbi:MAG: hypothetical protein OXE97_03180 [Gammaproteobacteria bacterium]|nr:hypothetical protein [Gammaproteobacteria bacterium]MCY4282387.1 hypothetical protein [Gammaproteobacteria bacterium]
MNKIGIICALRFEARCFTSATLLAQQPVELNDKTLLILSGMGAPRARQAAQQLVEAGVNCLVSFGAAGALDPALGPGDLMAPQEVCTAGKKYTVSKTMPAAAREHLSRHNVRIHSGLLTSASEPLTSAADKQALFRQSGAIAVDMESAAVLDMAQRHGLSACVLRVILDAAHVTLPAAALRRVDAFGKADLPGLIGDLLRSSTQISPLLRLACASRRARRTMRLAAQAWLQSAAVTSLPVRDPGTNPSPAT